MKNGHSNLVLTTANRLLRYFESQPNVPCGIGPFNEIAGKLKVSRTTIQKVFDILSQKGVTRQDGVNKLLLRKPVSSDFFSVKEIENSKSDIIEKKIIRFLSSYKLKPGERFSELELAKKLNSSTILTREALLKIGQSGIIKKQPGQKWEVVEFSANMINEIAEIRRIYEGYAIQNIKTLKPGDEIWSRLLNIQGRHIELLKQKEITAKEVRDIEHDFHTTIIHASDNRFIEKSYNSIFTLIFFHLGQIEYDKAKIERVLKQHTNILKALLSKKFNEASLLMEQHLEHAKDSMNKVNQVLQKKK